ncbi:hypothetical protein VSS74_26185 [Conexibacter stalactiti]|uniref:DUF5667 domain-containing protein n=1 Tax=Conexibacter stalactiti TaxID=1940611 RepID=A0ABU4HXB9_9ACTN|nr:hypothetical protein [Conexibacter stalactiti]MDW5597870.1 hypothetical protein [Conexibacter stalactiti]MEC5038512.1 hypothetical protein [Conexibacter stalactiti]
MKQTISTALAALALSGAAAAPAVADDASLKQTVEHQERSGTRALNAFNKATDAWRKSGSDADLKKLRSATGRQLTQIERYQEAVEAEEPSSKPYAKAKRALLTALGQLEDGYTSLNRAFARLLEGESRRAVLREVRAADRKLDAASASLKRAKLLIGD